MNLLQDYRSKVSEEIREVVLKGRSPLLELDLMLAYHLGFSDELGNLKDSEKGKYLRPLFCMAMCAGLGGNPEQAIPAAACLELAHRTSLIFDDIQDKGMERNNQPTVWAIWGADQAINAGFALSSCAHLALLELRRRDVPHEVTLEVWEKLENTILALCRGQFRDISFVERDDITVEDYMGMINGKTAALFATACEIGAMLATDDRRTINVARDFGCNVGTAFQIHDDYLGIWGDEATVGKTANDLVEKKMTLPVVLALEAFPEPVREFLNRETIDPMLANLMKDSMEKNGIRDKVKEIEGRIVEAARAELEVLRLEKELHEHLAGLLDFLAERKI